MEGGEFGKRMHVDFQALNEDWREERIEVARVVSEDQFSIPESVADACEGMGHDGVSEIANRYPGYLFIQIDRIERFLAARDDVEGVSVRMETEGFSFETKIHRPWMSIGVGEMVRIPVADEGRLSVRIVLVLHHAAGLFSGRQTKTCEIRLEFDAGRMNAIHNNLVENISRWEHYTSRNVLKNIRGLFLNETTDAWSLRMYLSFVSDDEVRMMPVPAPADLLSLSKWLVIRKFSYRTWFAGFASLRGSCAPCTGLWKRRYLRCHGYVVFVFNEHSRSLVGTINLVDAWMDAEREHSDNTVGVSVDAGTVEMHFDLRERFEMCRNALAAMLPQGLFHR